MKTSKKEVYSSFGIEYKDGKILSPLFGYINPLLINGNAKLGKGVWTFSTLAGTEIYNVSVNSVNYAVKGTCACDCKGCYAKSGFFRMNSTVKSLAVKTILSREHMDFVKRAIIAQILADNITLCRIHASGDFFSAEYAEMWKEIAETCDGCRFWTYTKVRDFENLFDGLQNANIVKSVIPACGFNFGHAEYIMETYKKLSANGENVHICKCGIDKNQHCTNCRGCSENKYVLFLEHSTAYKPETDSRDSWEEFKRLVESLNSKA